ncbi:hypothetical protein QVD99_005754 [Batrachochytrium dendrobatidis]|nr:hypothetical protein O5D80_000765 [Batrachochytrium dendrobatidis]KAK5667640.1 hypothetical protein QVD99_005754 [Batrachochytrium dendrobatidis]
MRPSTLSTNTLDNPNPLLWTENKTEDTPSQATLYPKPTPCTSFTYQPSPGPFNATDTTGQCKTNNPTLAPDTTPQDYSNLAVKFIPDPEIDVSLRRRYIWFLHMHHYRLHNTTYPSCPTTTSSTCNIPCGKHIAAFSAPPRFRGENVSMTLLLYLITLHGGADGVPNWRLLATHLGVNVHQSTSYAFRLKQFVYDHHLDLFLKTSFEECLNFSRIYGALGIKQYQDQPEPEPGYTEYDTRQMPIFNDSDPITSHSRSRSHSRLWESHNPSQDIYHSTYSPSKSENDECKIYTYVNETDMNDEYVHSTASYMN